ncbi:putative phenylacetic acid degradation protein [Burkholderia anthina]|nr:putative phenylacetic acid degradation protein [Burkholderia anthina]
MRQCPGISGISSSDFRRNGRKRGPIARFARAFASNRPQTRRSSVFDAIIASHRTGICTKCGRISLLIRNPLPRVQRKRALISKEIR